MNIDSIAKSVLTPPVGMNGNIRKEMAAEAAAAARVPLLLIGTPSAALLAQQPLLDKERVGEALRTINRGSLVPTNGPARWGSTWMQCMRMVLNNKCAAVC